MALTNIITRKCSNISLNFKAEYFLIFIAFIRSFLPKIQNNSGVMHFMITLLNIYALYSKIYNSFEQSKHIGFIFVF